MPVAVVAVALLVLATGCFRIYDFDGDDRSDLVWLRPNGQWTQAADPAPVVLATSAPGAFGVAGDYDGDGRWEPAEVQPTGYTWQDTWVTHGPAGTITFAPPPRPVGYEQAWRYALVPVPGIYDGGHRTVPAWYRDFDGTWFIAGHAPIQFGTGPTNPVLGANPTYLEYNLASDQDVPVPADYDGDGTTDLAVYGPTTGRWRIRSSRTGEVTTSTLGGIGWVPVPADYDGVGHAQVSVINLFSYRDRGQWIVDGHAPFTVPVPPGSDGSPGNLKPAPIDSDGDGRMELAWISMRDLVGSTDVWHVPATATTAARTVALPIDETVQPVTGPTWPWETSYRLGVLWKNACTTSWADWC